MKDTKKSKHTPNPSSADKRPPNSHRPDVRNANPPGERPAEKPPLTVEPPSGTTGLPTEGS